MSEVAKVRDLIVLRIAVWFRFDFLDQAWLPNLPKDLWASSNVKWRPVGLNTGATGYAGFRSCDETATRQRGAG
jgi:hypothetical protein